VTHENTDDCEGEAERTETEGAEATEEAGEAEEMADLVSPALCGICALGTF
jgi:hypothetical protein